MTAVLGESRRIRSVAWFLTVFYGAWLIFLVLVAITGIGPLARHPPVHFGGTCSR